MYLYAKCCFDNEPEFDRALEYLTPIVASPMAYTGPDFDLVDNEWIIEVYLTQDQLNGLTALCPIRPRREISKQRVISKIAFGIGRYGMSYHPDDHLDDEAWEDADILGLDVYDIVADLMKEFGIINIKD